LEKIDTLVLGCTHYRSFYRLLQSIPSGVTMIDSGKHGSSGETTTGKEGLKNDST